MKVIGLKILDEFAIQHGDIRGQISAWVAEIKIANWKTPAEIRARFAQASFLSDNRVVFNIKGNRYRLEVKVSYKNEIVLIKRIGTHAEYSKWL
jgi:mRNA interferase HigB